MVRTPARRMAGTGGIALGLSMLVGATAPGCASSGVEPASAGWGRLAPEGWMFVLPSINAFTDEGSAVVLGEEAGDVVKWPMVSVDGFLMVRFRREPEAGRPAPRELVRLYDLCAPDPLRHPSSSLTTASGASIRTAWPPRPMGVYQV